MPSVLTNRIFFALSEFRSLERLHVFAIYNMAKVEGSVECLKQMTRLKHLSISYGKLTEDFFKNMKKHLPSIR